MVILFLQIICYYAVLPDNFFRESGSGDFSVKAYPYVSAKALTGETAVAASKSVSGESRMLLTLYGVIPIKEVTVINVQAPMLIPSGEALGLKMLTDGVCVTDYGSVNLRSPAKECGIQIGDVITAANGKKISSSAELSKAVQLNEKETILTVLREDKEITIRAVPEKSKSDGLYKLGIWTRDSCAGIGTLTYYDESNYTYGGLGHSVCDINTGTLLPLASGEIVPVNIDSIIKGVNGCPGELCGTFEAALPKGNIELNTECGVFGKCAEIPEYESLPMAFKQEIEIGEAQIITTIDGTKRECFDILIEKVNYNSDSMVKNMVIRITDEELLAKAGGIVQGMSGSPIIQNGKLVGAVTHVFVNDISRGYAIFAENMYEVSSRINSQDHTDAA